MNENQSGQLAAEARPLLHKIDAVGWGIFLIWIGVAFLADMSWGAGLIGVGVIVLGGQAARKFFQLPVEWYSLALGGIFTVWGVMESLRLQFGGGELSGGLLPVLFIVAGIALVVSALRRKSHH